MKRCRQYTILTQTLQTNNVKSLSDPIDQVIAISFRYFSKYVTDFPKYSKIISCEIIIKSVDFLCLTAKMASDGHIGAENSCIRNRNKISLCATASISPLLQILLTLVDDSMVAPNQNSKFMKTLKYAQCIIVFRFTKNVKYDQQKR